MIGVHGAVLEVFAESPHVGAIAAKTSKTAPCTPIMGGFDGLKVAEQLFFRFDIELWIKTFQTNPISYTGDKMRLR